MKNLIFIMLVVSIPFYAQTQKEETPKDSLPPLKKENLKLNEKLDYYLKLDNEPDKKLEKNNIFNSDIPEFEPLQKNESKKKEFDPKLPPLDIYTGPPLESNTFSRNPFINDYRFNSGMDISYNAWLSTSSMQNTYPSLGAVRMLNANFNYQPLDWLVISGGPYAAKYNLMGNSYNDIGANGNLKFILHDRIRLNTYGQYSVYGDKNMIHGPMMNMFPQTYYGGSIEVKITEKFGVEGGIIRELNPFNGKWENRPFFAPVFYK
ncbi:hypothetical protein GGR21_002017 [Dysgonomonas hofstadii]|uniref:Uncharacterized protein n=1 Tax=Dysgonomonas hofstadii TaxID=637886 RepID=A0A840CL71_9BACT|nr:hypothetical protein [Dysgonomonas hofstadii]MBB4036116.1 hypothetical protein [Dysgonomonas hofstadii]